MASDITVAEAAERLGISKPRVYQLVESGALTAEKAGGIWLIDRLSVEARLENRAAVNSSRRTQQQALSSAPAYELMNRTHSVLVFRYDDASGAFSEAEKVHDAARAPLGLVSPRGSKVSGKALRYWWTHRSIPASRKGMRAKLAELGLEDVAQVPFRNFGLSLSDQYWVRPLGSSVQWEDVNYFQNEFAEMKLKGDWLSGVGLNSPDNTSEGELPKKWLCDGNKRLLAKGGSVLGQEPYNEAVATALYRRLLRPGDYQPYELRKSKLGTISVCENFINNDEEYIPAYYVRESRRQANHHSDYQHYLECCVTLGVSEIENALEKMIVCDDILGNFDRHWRNFGVVRNVEALEFRVAPLFDSGSSLWCTTPVAQLQAGNFSFSTKPFYEDANRQLRLVQDYSWFDIDALDGFTDEASAILSRNAAITNRVDLICCGIQSRIDRIRRVL